MRVEFIQIGVPDWYKYSNLECLPRIGDIIRFDSDPKGTSRTVVSIEHKIGSEHRITVLVK